MKLHSLLMTISKLVLIALMVAPFAHSYAPGQSSPQFSDSSAQLVNLSYLSVFGDFDGDRLLDQAQPHLAGAHQCIRVRFGNSLESHLEFGGGPQSSGALLARDINHDNKADLIWVYQSRSQLPVVWLSDGLGSFAKAPEFSTDADLRGLLSGDSSPAVDGDVNDDRACLAPQSVFAELTRVQNLEDDAPKAQVFPDDDCRRALEIYLSCPQDRGPPSTNYFV